MMTILLEAKRHWHRRQWTIELVGPFETVDAANKYANAWCHLWRDEKPSAAIKFAFSPSDTSDWPDDRFTVERHYRGHEAVRDDAVARNPRYGEEPRVEQGFNDWDNPLPVRDMP